LSMIDKNGDAPVSRKRAAGGTFSAQVCAFLNERLQKYGLDCEQLYITTVNDVVDPRVTFSQSLLGLGNDTLEWGSVQTHVHGLTGIFTELWTFEAQYSFSKLSFYDVEKLMGELLAEARSHWML